MVKGRCTERICGKRKKVGTSDHQKSAVSRLALPCIFCISDAYALGPG